VKAIKKTFTYSVITITDTKTKKIIFNERREGRYDQAKAAILYFKKSKKYNPYMAIQVDVETETFVLSAAKFMELGEKILPKKGR
jgi:hypothetical protein